LRYEIKAARILLCGTVMAHFTDQGDASGLVWTACFNLFQPCKYAFHLRPYPQSSLLPLNMQSVKKVYAILVQNRSVIFGSLAGLVPFIPPVI